jgi:hypothetical protein
MTPPTLVSRYDEPMSTDRNIWTVSAFHICHPDAGRRIRVTDPMSLVDIY